MEKRTILAFALSFAVLIIWSLLFSPVQKKIPENGNDLNGKTDEALTEPWGTAQSTDHKVSNSPYETQNNLKTEAKEKEVEIDTPLYSAVFSNRGPSIKSFRLKKYHQTIAPDSPPVELANLEKEIGDFLTIGFKDSLTTHSKKTIYQVDQKNIRLSPESLPMDLVFRVVTSSGLSINQTFRFYSDQYAIDSTIEVINQSGETINGTFTAELSVMPPTEKHGYYSYIGFAILLNNEVDEVEFEESIQENTRKGLIDWMAYEDDYFISAVIPAEPQKAFFEGHLLRSGVLSATYSQPSVSLNSFQHLSSQFTLYFGPRDLKTMKQVGGNLDRAVNFGWTDIIARPLLYALHFFNKYIHNYGVSIIILTVLIKILFWPLTHKSYKSMKEMQKLQPRMAKIREKYKGNKEQLNKEMMALYKTYKVNPMGGCLPMLVQIPVFFALFRILGSAIELRHAPFCLWIIDLSAPDRLFNFKFSIPFMEPPYGIPVLTLLMGASMFVQQKMTPTTGDPAQAKIMLLLPIIFTVMFINFPSGLVLYWLVNNLLSIGQQYRILKKSA